jgi:hypothetical protein
VPHTFAFFANVWIRLMVCRRMAMSWSRLF